MHQDLKPENVLIKTENGRLVAYLGDVGVAKKFSNEGSLMRAREITTQAGTEEWMAPEMRNPDIIKLGKTGEDNKINFSKIDIFSLGLITLYCLDSPENFYKYSSVLNEKSRTLHEEYLPQLKSSMPIEFYCLLKLMLSFDWNARPSLEEIEKFTSVFLVKFLNFLKYNY